MEGYTRWEDNIKIDIKEIRIYAGNLIGSAKDMDYWRTFVNAAFYLQVAGVRGEAQAPLLHARGTRCYLEARRSFP